MIWWYLNHSWKRLNAFQLAHGSQPQAFLNPPQKKEEGGIGDSPKDHHDFLLSIFFLFFFGGNWRFVWNFQVIHSFFVLFYVGFQALANKVVGRRPFFFRLRNIHPFVVNHLRLPNLPRCSEAMLWCILAWRGMPPTRYGTENLFSKSPSGTYPGICRRVTPPIPWKMVSSGCLDLKGLGNMIGSWWE